MFTVFETEAALGDLRETFAYLNARTGSNNASRNMLKDYKESLSLLANTPFAFSAIKDRMFSSLGYRWLPLRSYVLFFTVNNEHKEVYVERILHGSRNWRQLL